MADTAMCDTENPVLTPKSEVDSNNDPEESDMKELVPEDPDFTNDSDLPIDPETIAKVEPITANLDEKVIICRLCFKIIGDDHYETLEDIGKEVLDMVLLNYMDFKRTENPVACAECSKKLTKFYNMKLTLLNTEERIKNFAAKHNLTKVNIEDVMRDMKESENTQLDIKEAPLENVETAEPMETEEVKVKQELADGEPEPSEDIPV